MPTKVALARQEDVPWGSRMPQNQDLQALGLFWTLRPVLPHVQGMWHLTEHNPDVWSQWKLVT